MNDAHIRNPFFLMENRVGMGFKRNWTFSKRGNWIFRTLKKNSCTNWRKILTFFTNVCLLFNFGAVLQTKDTGKNLLDIVKERKYIVTEIRTEIK